MTRGRRLALALVSLWLGAMLFLTLVVTPALICRTPVLSAVYALNFNISGPACSSAVRTSASAM